MKTRKLLGSLIALSTMAFVGCQDADINTVEAPVAQDNVVRAGDNNGQAIAGQYIVVLKGSSLRLPANATYAERIAAVKAKADNMFQRLGVNGTVEHAYGKALVGFSGTFSDSDIEKLSNDSEVSYVENDRVLSIFRGKPGGGGGSAAQETPWGITRVGGGANYTGSNVAWVIDSGIDASHEDLNVNVGMGFNAFTKGKDADLSADGNGHGTHVAGTIGAINNSVGVIGVAAGVTVVPVKVLDSRGSGQYSGVIGGVDFVAANGSAGDVANMSLGGPISQALDDAIASAAQSSGVKFTLAAGNESQDSNNTSPARVNGNNIYTISASDVNDNFASFSNFANPPVDFCEPGVSILSTYKGGGYASLSGTSMAAPHAAGLLLLGNISNGGSVNNDPDGNPDTIGVR